MLKILKNIALVGVFLGLFFSPIPADADVSVKGYYKQNGTYVQPHRRSDPNSTTRDNWSTKGNVNPYTGKRGTRYNRGSTDYNSGGRNYNNGGINTDFMRY